MDVPTHQNHEGPATNGNVILGVSVAFTILTVLAVATRLYLRNLSISRFRREDWLVVVALFFAVLLGITSAIGASDGGVGSSLADLTKDQATVFNRILLLSQFFYIAAAGLAKLAVLALYRRAFRTSRTPVAIIVFSNVVWLWMIVFLLMTLLQYNPFLCIWHTDSEKVCEGAFNTTYMYIGSSASDVALDVLVLSLPPFYISRLHMPLGKQVAVSAIFGLGCLCIIASVSRLAYSVKMLQIYSAPEDLSIRASSWANWILWSEIEAYLSTICACIPCFGPLVPWDRLDKLFSGVRGRLPGLTTKATRETPTDRTDVRILREATRTKSGDRVTSEISIVSEPARSHQVTTRVRAEDEELALPSVDSIREHTKVQLQPDI